MRTRIPTPELNRFLAEVVAGPPAAGQAGPPPAGCSTWRRSASARRASRSGQQPQPRHPRLRVLHREPPARALRLRRRPADHRLQRAQAAALGATPRERDGRPRGRRRVAARRRSLVAASSRSLVLVARAAAAAGDEPPADRRGEARARRRAGLRPRLDRPRPRRRRARVGPRSSASPAYARPARRACSSASSARRQGPTSPRTSSRGSGDEAAFALLDAGQATAGSLIIVLRRPTRQGRARSSRATPAPPAAAQLQGRRASTQLRRV